MRPKQGYANEARENMIFGAFGKSESNQLSTTFEAATEMLKGWIPTLTADT